MIKGSRCRNLGGSTIVFVRTKDLRWIAGKDCIQAYEPTVPDIYARYTCGASLDEIVSAQDSFPVATNALDGDPDLPNPSHEFVGETSSWYDICDDAPRNEAHPAPA